MEPAKRRSYAFVAAVFAVSLVVGYRLVQWLIYRHLPPLALWDVPVAAAVAFLVTVRMLDRRTWSYTETSRLRQNLYTIYISWLVYGAAFGCGLALPFGLTMGMAYGFAIALALVAVVGSIIAVVRRIQDAL